MSEGELSAGALDEPEDPRAPAQKRGGWDRFSPLLSKVALELFIVFVGVTAAFAVDDYRGAREQNERRHAVYRALDRELEQVAETHGPIFQREMTEQLTSWDRAISRGQRPLPPAFRTPRGERPPTGVWDAAIASGTIELIDPEFMFELARYYTRANSVGDLSQRYSAAAQENVWPHLSEGPSAFWSSNGRLHPDIAVHVQRLRDFRDRQGKLVEEANVLREKLKRASED